MSDNLAVGLTAHLDAGVFQLTPEQGEVFHDAVVYNGNLAAEVDVWMSISIRRPTMCCPAGVADPGPAGQLSGTAFVDMSLEISQRARLLGGVQGARTIDDRN